MDNSQQNIESRVRIAYLPAGSNGTKLVKGTPKAFLDVAGRMAILRCLDAINKSSIDTVITWHEDVQRLQDIITKNRGDFSNISNILVLQAQKDFGNNMVFSTTNGLLKHSHLPKYTGKWNDFNAISKYRLDNPEADDEPVLILPVDAVLLSEDCLDKYIDQFNKFPDMDLIIGYTKKEIIEGIGKVAGKNISDIDSTINRYDYAKDYAGRHSNLFIIKPVTLMEKEIIDFMRYYNKNRYQSKLKSRIAMYVQGCAAAFSYRFRKKYRFSSRDQDKIPLSEDIGLKAKYFLDIIETALFYNNFNKAKSRKLPLGIVKKARQKVTIEKAEQVLEKIFDLKARIYKDGGIEVMDIDDEICYNIINNNYSRIMEYGNSLSKNERV
ncbi:MAG: hypothetical protein KAS15_01180 [Nanoarchaeota archaeon]|nr:hypothetical protein [Nanoarchaeota archaeon]